MTAIAIGSRQRDPRGAPDRPTTWREKVAILGALPKLLGLVWRTHRGYTTAMVGLRLVRSLIPVATLWVGKLIIDAVIHAAKGGPTAALWRYLAIEIVIVLSGEFLARASSLLESLLGDLFSNVDERAAHAARGHARSRAVRGSRHSTITSSAPGDRRRGGSD